MESPVRRSRPAPLPLILLLFALPGPAGPGRAEGGPGPGASHVAAPVRTVLVPVVFNSVCEASRGVLPDSACPSWPGAVTDSTPKFTGGTLRVHTTTCSKNASYGQAAADLVIPDTLVVETRLRFDTGSECVGPCGHYRQAANVAITTSGSTGVLFFIGDDEIFLTTGECAAVNHISIATKDVPREDPARSSSSISVRAWPNPAQGETRIAWTLTKTAHVRVGVFDLSGRLVRRLREDDLAPGFHTATWDGRDAGGGELPAGICLCRVESGDGIAAARMIRTR